MDRKSITLDLAKIGAGLGVGAAAATGLGGGINSQDIALEACRTWQADYKNHVVVGDSESYEGKFIERDSNGEVTRVLFLSWPGQGGVFNEEMAFDIVPNVENEDPSVLATSELAACMKDGSVDVAPFQ